MADQRQRDLASSIDATKLDSFNDLMQAGNAVAAYGAKIEAGAAFVNMKARKPGA